MVCLFQLHAFCRRPAQPVGRGFDYRYGLAAKPATSRLFGEIRPVLVADFRLFGSVRRVRLGVVRCHHDVFGDFHRIVPDSQCSAVFARDSFLP